MDQIWMDLYNAAKAVQNDRVLSEQIRAGCVAAAVESNSGKIYVGVCVDTACSLGICAERNAIFNMITNGENELRRVVALMPNGKTGAPCGTCREFMAQLMPGKCNQVQIMMDYDTNQILTLSELTPEWWI